MSRDLESRVLVREDEATLHIQQQNELQCIRKAAWYGQPVDETCATWVDRHADEIDRRHAKMPLPAHLAAAQEARRRAGGMFGQVWSELETGYDPREVARSLSPWRPVQEVGCD
ncbi:hypothetical protein [Streptomyces albus]|uniref:hypothetical protein n=1 Tax=Streptomyces sp. NRRL F-5917 TaxID=1463873 RepID=UPI0004C0A826|nr:hypothetical protein [Streptomyces sp. NRRL F-5917]